PPMVIGGGSYLDQLATLAGAANVFHDIGAASATVALETIATRDPDVIAVVSDSAEPRPPAFARRREWRVVPAGRGWALVYVVGGSLALSGAGLQALVRNPLADPFLLGLSGGAGLGAVVAIALHLASPWALPLAAFVGALGATALVYRLGLVGGAELDPRVLILAGVAVGAFAAAVTTAIVSLSDAAELRNTFLWLWGGLSGASWDTVLLLG